MKYFAFVMKLFVFCAFVQFTYDTSWIDSYFLDLSMPTQNAWIAMIAIPVQMLIGFIGLCLIASLLEDDGLRALAMSRA